MQTADQKTENAELHPRHAPRRSGAPALLGLLLFAFYFSVPARGDWTLTDADFKTQQHLTINTWKPDAGLSATSEAGTLVTIPTRNVLTLDSGLKVAAYPGSSAWKLSLLNGDVLYGDPVKVDGRNLLFTVDGIDGDLAIPEKYIVTLSAPVYGPAAAAARSRKLPAAQDRDIIVFKQADNLAGIFTGIDESSVKFAADGANGEESTLPLANIDTIIFGGARPPRAVPPLSARLSFDNGSVLTVPIEGKKDSFDWQIGTLTIRYTNDQPHAIHDNRLVSVETVGGRVVWLTEIDPEKEVQVPFIGASWPMQVNKNVLGQPLRVGHAAFDRGIGVHTQDTLVYDLDGTFDTLSLRVGLDDSAAPNGEARASVVLDGKVLWEATTLKPGELSPELSLPIAGGRKLELHADPTTRLDVQGRVDWVNLALRRK